MIDVRAMTDADIPAWAALRQKLWDDCTDADNQVDIAAYRKGDPIKAVFLAFNGPGSIGFAEISERSVVDSCDGPAAYLEGWYVDPGWRGQRAGAALIAAARDWARAAGYDWLGSDVELDNITSQTAHLALGFEETGRVVTYRMRLA